MKNLLFILLVIFVAHQGVYAGDKDSNDPNELVQDKWDAVVNDPNDPNELLQAKWDSVIKVLQTEELDQEAKAEVVDRIVSPIFNFALMGKLALGRTHWPKFTDPQREKFTRLFAKRLKDSYREKISLYTDEKALLKPAMRKKKAVLVPMQLISGDKNIDILYKFRKVGKCWKIYDMEIQGVSIILTYRSQFNDILCKGTVEDILSQLEKPQTR